MTKIVVFGSSGVLGNIIVDQVISQFGAESLIVSDYSAKRASILSNALNLPNKPRIIDVNDLSSIRSGLDGIDAAIIATKQLEPLIQQECIQRGIVTVDVTVFSAFIYKIQQLSQKENSAPTVVMAGYFPGLSGMAVNELVTYFDVPQKIQVSLLQNTNATAGAYGFADMLNIINAEVSTDQGLVKGFTFKRECFHKDRNRTFNQYLIKSDEADILSSVFNLDISYFTGWGKTFFNRLIQFSNKIGLSHFLANSSKGSKLSSILKPSKKYAEENQECTSLTIIGEGIKAGVVQKKAIYINAKADYLATAIIAVTMTRLILGNRETFNGGVFMPYQIVSLQSIRRNVEPFQINIIGV